MISLVSTYFSKKRSLAIGVVACGSATGGLVFPAMVQQLLPKVGFGWILRALGFVQLACLVTCIIFTKQRLPPRRIGPIVEWAAFKELPYSLFAAGIFVSTQRCLRQAYPNLTNLTDLLGGILCILLCKCSSAEPLYVDTNTSKIGSYARDDIGVSYNESINLILVLNGVGVIGRLLPNYYADLYSGPLNMMIPICAASAIIVYCWISAAGRGGLYTWAVVYGLFSAAIQSLFPAVLASLTTDLRKRGVRMGMFFPLHVK